MTREEFIEVLDNHDCTYKIDRDGEIVVTGGNGGYGRVDIIDIYDLPSGVEFVNDGHVIFNNVTKIPSGVFFRNTGDVELDSLEEISLDVEFDNEEDVILRSIKNIPQWLWFNNRGNVYLHSINIRTYSKSYKFPFEIKGVDNKRLLNFMISKGMFI